MRIWAVFEALFLIITGLIIAALWGVLLVNAQNSVMFNTPLRFSFHLFSECILTLMCIITGFGLLRNSDAFRRVSFFTFGLLISSGLNAVLFYLERKGHWGQVSAFGAILFISVICLVANFNMYGKIVKNFRMYVAFGLFNLGVLLYVLLNTAGDYGQQKKWDIFVILIYLIIIGALYTYSLLKKKK